MNLFFQFLWFKIVKRLIPVGNSLTDKIGNQHRRIVWQVRIARALTKDFRVMFGDSNSAVFQQYNLMRRYKKLTINIGVGGTEATDWVKYFAGDGADIYKEIAFRDCIINVGGNYIMLDRMKDAKTGLLNLRYLFPASWNCTVPPVNYKLLGEITGNLPVPRPEQYYRDSVQEINAMIKNMWDNQTIDLYAAFLLPDESVQPWVFRDGLMHWANWACRAMLVYFNEV